MSIAKTFVHFQPNAEVIYNRIDNEAVIIHLVTNRIYDLNPTASRFWEILCSGQSLEDCRQFMLNEFDVEEASLADEIERLVNFLEKENLVRRFEAS